MTNLFLRQHRSKPMHSVLVCFGIEFLKKRRRFQYDGSQYGESFHTATQSKAIALDIIRRAKKPLKIRDELVLKNMINQIPEKK